MNTLVIARRGLIPALLAFGIAAQDPILTTRSQASTPVPSAVQDGGDSAVEQLDALIARLRASPKDRALVRELETIAKALKAREDRAPALIPVEGKHGVVSSVPVRVEYVDAEGKVLRRQEYPAQTPTTASRDAKPQVAPVDQVVEIRSTNPEATVQVTQPSRSLRTGKVVTRAYPGGGVMTVGPEVIEYRGDLTLPEVTLVHPDLRFEVATPEVPVEVRAEGRALPPVTATRRRDKVDVTKELPAPAPTPADLDAGLADIERELREIRELIEQIRHKAAQAPKRDR